MRAHIPFLVVGAALIGAAVALSVTADSAEHVERAEVMGATPMLVRVVGDGTSVSGAEAARLAVAAVRDAESALSRYREDSDISRLSDAPTGEPVAVGEHAWRTLLESARVHRLSGGAFDPSVAPLLDIYEFPSAADPVPPVADAMPSGATVAEALSRVGFDALEFLREGCRVVKTKDGMAFDLGAVAKGYAVDAAVETLERLGVRDALVEIGGEVRVMGERPDGSPWRIGVADPRRPDGEPLRTVDAPGLVAVATSGDYRKFFIHDGTRYSHIVDPRTGRPVSGDLAAVTVASPRSCAEADALATAACVLGMDAAAEMLDLFPGTRAWFQFRLPDGGLRVETHPGRETNTFPPLAAPSSANPEDDAETLD